MASGAVRKLRSLLIGPCALAKGNILRAQRDKARGNFRGSGAARAHGLMRRDILPVNWLGTFVPEQQGKEE